LLLTAFIVGQLAVIQTTKGEFEAVAESTSFEVYVDGYVSVELTVNVDPRNPTANITIIGQVISDVLVVDETNLPLDYFRDDILLSIHTLGVTKVKISYFTQDLTEKDGRFWTFNVSTTTNSSILLPSQATLVDFNPVPDLIESYGEQTLLLVPAGQIQLTYVLGVVGSKEYAHVVLNSAEQKIKDIKARNISVASAEVLLQQAWTQFDSGSYIEAETLASQAGDLADETNQTATLALETITSAGAKIIDAESEGRTSGLEAAQSLLAQSQTSMDEGNYTGALALANEAVLRAQESVLPSPNQGPSQTPAIAGQSSLFIIGEIAAGAIIASAIGFAAIRRWQKKTALEEVKKKKVTDLEKIFKRNQLRREEQDAVRLISENKGEMLEAELYARLSLPRTTTWRLVKRLEDMGIVEIAKFRRDNMIRLKKR
jgi:uncharacterized membrane protein